MYRNSKAIQRHKKRVKRTEYGISPMFRNMEVSTGSDLKAARKRASAILCECILCEGTPHEKQMEMKAPKKEEWNYVM